jgi:hypothetical protein
MLTVGVIDWGGVLRGFFFPTLSHCLFFSFSLFDIPRATESAARHFLFSFFEAIYILSFDAHNVPLIHTDIISTSLPDDMISPAFFFLCRRRVGSRASASMKKKIASEAETELADVTEACWVILLLGQSRSTIVVSTCFENGIPVSIELFTSLFLCVLDSLSPLESELCLSQQSINSRQLGGRVKKCVDPF